jgi:hypothetical protein
MPPWRDTKPPPRALPLPGVHVPCIPPIPCGEVCAAHLDPIPLLWPDDHRGERRHHYTGFGELISYEPQRSRSTTHRRTGVELGRFGIRRNRFKPVSRVYNRRPRQHPATTVASHVTGVIQRCLHPPVRCASSFQTPMQTHWKESEMKSATKASVMKSDSARVSQLRPPLRELTPNICRQTKTIEPS